MKVQIATPPAFAIRKNGIFFILITILCLVFASCSDDNDDPLPSSSPVTFYVPEGFPQPVYDFQNNPLTEEGFALGRKLFYDPILSRDSSISCGSCHQQFVAFANSDHRFSHGIDDLLGSRNTPGLFNMAWFPNFMWDGGVNHIEVQPLAPITNPIEMDESIANVIVKLQRSPVYRSMFLSAFDTDSVTTQLTMRAMAQFMAAMISDDSPYDKYRKGTGSLNAAELRGLQLFRSNCESCHREPLLTDMQFRNNGLSLHYHADPGRALITGLPQDSGLFRVPSLRNVALTFPYMHDGRFQSLNQVLDHYTNGVQPGVNLDPLLISSPIVLSTQDKSDIISFLNALTDQRFITDSRFSEVN